MSAEHSSGKLSETFASARTIRFPDSFEAEFSFPFNEGESYAHFAVTACGRSGEQRSSRYRPGPSKSRLKVKNRQHPALMRVAEAHERERRR